MAHVWMDHCIHLDESWRTHQVRSGLGGVMTLQIGRHMNESDDRNE